MQHVYPYKTTTDKLSQAYEHIESSGHTVEQATHIGGRDWVLICRSGPARDIAVRITGDPSEFVEAMRQAERDAGEFRG